MSERPVDQVGVDLLDDGVAAVLGLGLDDLKRAVGENRVVAVEGEQFVLAIGDAGVQAFDAADDEAGGHRLVLLGRERGVAGLGDLGVRDPGARILVEDRVGVSDRRPGARSDRRDRLLDLLVHLRGDREPHAGADAGVNGLGGVKSGIAPGDQQPARPGRPRGGDVLGQEATGATR